ncbi:Zinc knuckle [Geosmithia morbida]|uniref:Zinc knuckle n=1 Tax=Geosmithia morbida TaxID=1094350 RepID=A0A9P5D7R2_9HYPO|nr:Zinc knuckle [Geosmithia morbida]KAF4126886.1 Zinc knuckle [Geosmithia morbida]
MAGSAAGQPNRPDEPQCYNCGALGHWAIACPEPTRATPAGFETWRNTSSHAGHQGHHAKDHRGHKKSKGPVITRYAPPAPESAYSPQPAYYHGPSPYPPPPPGVQKDAKRPESRAASEIGGAVSAASPDRRSQLGAAGIEPVPTRVLGKTNQEYGQKLVGNPGPRPQKSDLSLPEKPGIKPTKHGSIESIPKGTAKPDHKRNSVDRDGAFPTVPQSPSAHQRRDGAVQQRSNSYSVEELDDGETHPMFTSARTSFYY